jgi:hypothetical protein
VSTQFENYSVFDDDDDDPILLNPAGLTVDTWRENYPFGEFQELYTAAWKAGRSSGWMSWTTWGRRAW